jgi:hypothetical protein
MTIRPLLRIFHVIAGLVAFVTIACFLGSTLWVELSGEAAGIAAAKSWIVSRLPLLIISLAIAGGTGFALSGGHPKGLAAKKLQRMKIIASNGIFILVPAALFLNLKAQQAEFDALFYVVQLVEIAVGALNLTLLGLSMRDGLAMKGRLRRLKLS